MRTGLILLLLLASACARKEPAPAPLPHPVRVAKVASKDVPIFIEGLGHVEPITSINILSRIEGELTGVHFLQGQEVKKGDLLFTIDPKPYQAALKQAQGTLEQSLANLAISEERVKRYKTLARDEYYSQIDFETLQANFAANSGVVAQNQANVDSAAINLDYCWIYAPIDGMMGILKVDYGNLVRADGEEALAVLNQMTPIFITFSVPEIQLPRIQKWIKNSQTPLKVVGAYENFAGEVFEGSLYMLDNQVDNQTGMIKLRGIFENEKRMLWPGQFIRTRLYLYTAKNAAVMPYSAVQLTLDGPVVFVLEQDGTVERRPIKLGQREEDQVIILEGVSTGEMVVVEGQLNLSGGTKVAVKE